MIRGEWMRRSTLVSEKVRETLRSEKDCDGQRSDLHWPTTGMH